MAYRERMADGTVRIVNDRVNEAWPVGAVYTSFDSTDPGTIFGGSWARVAKGRVLVGVDEADARWDSSGDLGGSAEAALSVDQLPPHAHPNPHTHPIDHNHAGFTTSSDGGHVHSLTRRASAGTTGGVAMGLGTLQTDVDTTSNGGHQHTANVPAYTGNSGAASAGTGSVGSGTPVSLIQPYLAVYIWRRTA